MQTTYRFLSCSPEIHERFGGTVSERPVSSEALKFEPKPPILPPMNTTPNPRSVQAFLNRIHEALSVATREAWGLPEFQVEEGGSVRVVMNSTSPNTPGLEWRMAPRSGEAMR